MKLYKEKIDKCLMCPNCGLSTENMMIVRNCKAVYRKGEPRIIRDISKVQKWCPLEDINEKAEI